MMLRNKQLIPALLLTLSCYLSLGKQKLIEASPQLNVQTSSSLLLQQQQQLLLQQQQQQQLQHQDLSHTFTCGKLYYRTFYLDQHRNVLYVGAM